MRIRVSSYEISGGHKGWDHSRCKGDLAHPPQGLSSPTLHCILISCITLQPFHASHHSGFPKSRSVKCQLHLIFSLLTVSLSPTEARGPTRKCRCVHFCKVPSLSLSGSSFLGPCWNRVDGNEMGKFWHHWLTWCCCSLLLVQMDWSEIPPDWQVFLLRAYPGDFPGHSQVGDPQIHSFLFNQGKCSGTHSSPPAEPLCFPHSASTIWRILSSPPVSCLLAHPQETHVS